MKKIAFIITLVIILLPIRSDSMDNGDPKIIFQEFWKFVDENYIYFNLKNVNWDKVYTRYETQITSATTDDELFDIMEAALLELQDTHNRLESPKRAAKIHDFREGFSIFDTFDIVLKNYVVDSLGQDGYLSWYMLEGDVGYIRLPKFNHYGAFRSLFEEFKSKNVEKLVIDVRGNGGGDSNDVPDLLSILARERTLLGYYVEKSGPGHDDVTTPIPVYAYPDSSFFFDKPIVVLIDRACYSATSYFAAMISSFDNVTLIGQVTGGGGGGNMGYQLSNGWLVAVSVSDFLNGNSVSIESGVQPDLAVQNTTESIADGIDLVLEAAIQF